MNQTIRRYPRTLQQAFGPHTSNVIHTVPRRSWIGIAGYSVLAIVAIGGALFVRFM